jgi:AraC-like DNA-binding protein
MHLAIQYAQKCTEPSKSFNQQTQNRLNGAIQRIHNSLSDRITWQQIASSSKFSPYHFSRLFKARTGLSPRQYIISARLDKAKSLLTETDYTVNEIAEVCGFHNASHLGSTFSKHFGMTPSQFRSR